MAEAITFDSATSAVVAYLKDALADRDFDVPVGTRVPHPRPALFVRVLHTGGSRRNLAQSDAQVTVECWAQPGGEIAAEQLALTTYGLMSAMDTDDGYVPIGSPGVVGEVASLPDPDTDSARYVFTRIVRLRARTL